MKNKKNLLIILAIAAAVLVLAGVLIYQAIDARNTAKREEEYELRKADAVMQVLAPFAEKYGFDDIVLNETDFPSVGGVTAVITSEKFGDAEDATKLSFLSEVEFVTENQRYSSDDRLIHSIAKHGLSLKVISGEYSYFETVNDGRSQLRRAESSAAYIKSAMSPYKEVILSMETEHASDVEASLEKYLSDGEDCYWCKGTGAVKYYYGESDLEAIADGHDASWYGTCGSCGGTGKSK